MRKYNHFRRSHLSGDLWTFLRQPRSEITEYLFGVIAVGTHQKYCLSPEQLHHRPHLAGERHSIKPLLKTRRSESHKRAAIYRRDVANVRSFD